MPASLGSYKAGPGGGGPWRVHSLSIGFKRAEPWGTQVLEAAKGQCTLRVKVTETFLLPEQAGDGDVFFCFFGW